MLDNVERIIQGGVNAYKDLCRSALYIPGAGASEMYLANTIKSYGKTITTLDQYGIDKFGEAFEVVPRTLLDNSGYNVHETLSTLKAKSLTDGKMGIDVKKGEIQNSFDLGVYDSLMTKTWGIKLAVEAVFTVLRIDQVIVAKPAGGPNLGKKPPGANEADEF